MSAIIPANLDLLRQAAELRADGTPWKAVAATLEISLGQLRRLADEHSRVYTRLSRRANRELMSDVLRRTVAKLSGLLESSDQSVVMMAAATIVRLDLAKTRARAQRGTRRRKRVRRDELPPAPSVIVSAQKTRCDTLPPGPEMPEGQRVAANPPSVQSARCDSVTAGRDSVTFDSVVRAHSPCVVRESSEVFEQPRPEVNEPRPAERDLCEPTPQPPAPPAQPVARNGKPGTMTAIRRKRWIPTGLRKSKDDEPAPIDATDRAPRPKPTVAGLMTSFLGS